MWKTNEPWSPVQWRARRRPWRRWSLCGAADVICGHPDYRAPERLVARLKEIIQQSGGKER